MERCISAVPKKGCPVGKAHVCEKCGFPMGDFVTERRCLNPACGNSCPICEKCGRPMRVRTGKYGQFLGCSGYGIKEDQCTNTRPLPHAIAQGAMHHF